MKSSRFITAVTGIIIFVLSALCQAAEQSVAKMPTLAEDNLAGNLLQTTLGLVFVLILIGAAAWAVKRFGNLKIGAQGRMKVVGGISLGTRERVVLLEVGKQQLVLGIAPGHISTLHVLDEPLPIEPVKASSGSFSERLQAVIKGQNPNQLSSNQKGVS